MKRSRPVIAAAALIAMGAAHAAPRVTVVSGVLEGMQARADGVALREFRGIPFAAPPLGDLRWRPPQPAARWRGVRPARRFGPRCMQLPLFGDMVFRAGGMSEDCLYLNVWTPARLPQSMRPVKLPVLVYFYGGGFVAGDGSEPRYDGASLAARGIVTVTVNYRLGVFGFLALPALAAESSAHAAGNYGLLDQIAALSWVKANIDRFGGDPGQVTIGGESAGSISVNALAASPRARGLFTRAIGESGALIAPIAPQTLAAAERVGAVFSGHVGARSLAALRAMPAAGVVAGDGPKVMPAMSVRARRRRRRSPGAAGGDVRARSAGRCAALGGVELRGSARSGDLAGRVADAGTLPCGDRTSVRAARRARLGALSG